MDDKKIVVAYVPVLHRGYIDFFTKHSDSYICIFSEGLIKEFPYLRKDIRALLPSETRFALQGLHIGPVYFADRTTLEIFQKTRRKIIMPNEDICHQLAENKLQGCEIEFDDVFLRWDSKSVLKENEVNYDRIISFGTLLFEMMWRAASESKKATNFWRQVGAVIARDEKVLLVAHNQQVPSPHTPYYEGDARMFFKKSIHIELTTDEHAESCIIAEAAKNGVALAGTDLYITTFPCPPCAKLVARTGIRRCYYTSGYSMLDGERVLKNAGVELISVTLPEKISR